MRDRSAEFAKHGVEIIGVSFDTPTENAKFKAEEHFAFPLLSDSDHKLAVAVGAADSPAQKYARRISYLVGPDGKVLEAYEKVSPKEHASQVLADLAALKR